MNLSSLCSGLVIAMVVSLIYIVLLRFLAAVMVWVMIVLVIIVIGYGKTHKVSEQNQKSSLKKINETNKLDRAQGSSTATWSMPV